ncbi:Longitudinals lacking protein-like [Orchesella cincta]|uniref:Longitudinals lacking protein-like n=1 Tax=Orchesella cincta TaxID=48709 RepID=A0A1D2M6Z3_ORCCI|nr:Longitudinals lacking protein-like [Orchesella cincta]
MAGSPNMCKGTCRIGLRNPEPTVINGFEKLFRTQTLTDVTISCQGSTINCHKLVLLACSSMFEKHLLRNDCPHPIIEIDAGIQFQQLTRILDYMYTGEVVVPQRELDGFLKAAKELEVKGLIETDSKSEEQEMTKAKTESNRAASTSKCKKYKKYAVKDMVSAIQAVKDGMGVLAAARLLKIPARTLYMKLKSLGIPRLGNCPNAKLMRVESREIPNSLRNDNSVGESRSQNM